MSPPIINVGVAAVTTTQELVVFDAGTGFMRWGREAGTSQAGRRGVLKGGVCVALLLLGSCLRCRMLPPPHVIKLFGHSYSCIAAAVSILAAFPGMPSPTDLSTPAHRLPCLLAAPYQPQTTGGQYSYVPVTSFANDWGHLAAVRCLGSDQPGSL